jgi:hypothetical protein
MFSGGRGHLFQISKHRGAKNRSFCFIVASCCTFHLVPVSVFTVLYTTLCSIKFIIRDSLEKFMTTCLDQCGHHKILKLLSPVSLIMLLIYKSLLGVFEFERKTHSTSHNMRDCTPLTQTNMRTEGSYIFTTRPIIVTPDDDRIGRHM